MNYNVTGGISTLSVSYKWFLLTWVSESSLVHYYYLRPVPGVLSKFPLIFELWDRNQKVCPIIYSFRRAIYWKLLGNIHFIKDNKFLDLWKCCHVVRKQKSFSSHEIFIAREEKLTWCAQNKTSFEESCPHNVVSCLGNAILYQSLGAAGGPDMALCSLSTGSQSTESLVGPVAPWLRHTHIQT